MLRVLITKTGELPTQLCLGLVNATKTEKSCWTNPPVVSGGFVKYLIALFFCVFLLPTFANAGGSTEIPALPALEDPQLANMLQRLAPEHNRWLNNPDGYLVIPAPLQDWPCEVSQREKERLSGVPDKQDPKHLAAVAQAERNSGSKRGSLTEDTIENVQVYILKGACSAGKLNGEVELMAEYMEGRHWGKSQWRLNRTFSRFKAVDGKRLGEGLTVQLIGDFHTEKVWNNKVKIATFILAGDEPHARTISITNSFIEGPKSFFGTKVKMTQMVSLVQPISGDRYKFVLYSGISKSMEAMHKGDKMHGKSRIFAYTDTNAYWEPVRVEARETCYDEGELIKSVACDVE